MFWGVVVRIKWNCHNNPSHNVLLGEFILSRNHCRLKLKTQTHKLYWLLYWLLELLFPFCRSVNSSGITNLCSHIPFLQKSLCLPSSAIQISTGLITQSQHLLVPVSGFGRGSLCAWEPRGTRLVRGYWACSQKSWSSRAWVLGVSVLNSRGFWWDLFGPHFESPFISRVVSLRARL